jgi:hypothetical protein
MAGLTARVTHLLMPVMAMLHTEPILIFLLALAEDLAEEEDLDGAEDLAGALAEEDGDR